VSSNNRQVIRSKIKEVPVAWGRQRKQIDTKLKETNTHNTRKNAGEGKKVWEVDCSFDDFDVLK